jgi:16S rRNA (uracil1498-N3)-methyltransferase
MDYFYCSAEKISGDMLIIDGEEFNHLVHVMRKKEGDEVRVVDGQGTAYDVRLGVLKKRTVKGTIFNVYRHHHEPSVSVTLGVGILKNPSKFDFLVEKATELGVNEIVPLKTERTIPEHAKTDRWHKLALAAMKQCGRSYLPNITSLTTLDECMDRHSTFDCKLIAHEDVDHSSFIERSTIASSTSIIVLIGPEGGFTDEEIERAVVKRFTPISLGERRLRTETAAIVAAMMILLPNMK